MPHAGKYLTQLTLANTQTRAGLPFQRERIAFSKGERRKLADIPFHFPIFPPPFGELNKTKSRCDPFKRRNVTVKNAPCVRGGRRRPGANDADGDSQRGEGKGRVAARNDKITSFFMTETFFLFFFWWNFFLIRTFSSRHSLFLSVLPSLPPFISTWSGTINDGEGGRGGLLPRLRVGLFLQGEGGSEAKRTHLPRPLSRRPSRP